MTNGADRLTSRFLPDTSCIVPALAPWHEHHAASIREMEQRLANGEQPVLAAPTLVECFSVLTRLPAGYRAAPSAVRDALADFLREGEVVSLNAEAYRQLVVGAPEAGIAGGRIYDAVILQCAIEAKVDVLLTFTERHFASLAGGQLQIVVPQLAW